MWQIAPATAAPYSSTVLADNPTAYWRFEDAAGPVATDSAGANNGTYVNVALGQASAFANLGSSGRFNGTGSTVDVPALGSFTNLSIEAWVNADTFPSGWSSLYNTDAFGGDKSHWQLFNSGATVTFEWALGFSDTNNTEQFSPDTWYHIVTTYDAASGAGRLYVDGQLQETLFTVPGKTTNLTDGQLGSWMGTQRFLNGNLDEVAVYGSVLSPERILAHYDAARTTTVSEIPEPATLALLGAALAGLGLRRARRARRAIAHNMTGRAE